MPELPEVETVRRGLEPAMLGKEIAHVFVARRDLRVPIPEHFEETLCGAQVQSLQRRGKYMLIHLSNAHSIIWHLGMSGRVAIIAPDQSHNDKKHDHVTIHMQDGTRIIYNDARRFGFMTLTDTDGWTEQKPFNTMGPEPLGNDFNGVILAQRLKGRKTPIKVALLDQKVVVGVGNIYACEALYRASISPFAQADSITNERAETLVTAIRQILNEAIASGGSSLKDHRQTDGSLGYFQHKFAVYDREGQCCGVSECATLAVDGCIQRVVQAGRSTFYCPNKQKE